MDVPYFLCPTDGSALLAPDGHVVSEAFFEGSGLERVRQRLREPELFPLDEHEALLRSTLETSRLIPPRLSPTSPREQQLPSPRWLDAALELGERVLAAALPEGERLSWLGLSYTPFHDHEELAPLGPDLLDGTAGLAVVLGELYAASGHERFHTAALGALSHVRQALAQAAEGMAPVGAFLGTGGQLYALVRCAEVLGMPELLEEARTRAEGLPLEELAAKAPPDVVTGATGLALALTSCGATSLARAMLRGIGQQLASATAPPPPAPPGSRASTRFPSPSEGLALCAPRLGEPCPEPPLVEPITAGALLARVELAAHAVGSREPVLAAVRSFLARSAHDGVERLEQLEVALTAAESLSDEESRVRAVQLGQSFLHDRVHSGRWFPERLAADHHQLSALWGLPALARAFLRLHAPSRFPSLNLIR
jgi:lantibiotic modifying enzyme